MSIVNNAMMTPRTSTGRMMIAKKIDFDHSDNAPTTKTSTMTPNDDDNAVEVLLARESHWQRPNILGLKRSARTYIMKWLYHHAYIIGLHPRTIMLAMSLLDRFASSRRLVYEEIERLTLACIWVAAKYEEVARFSLSTMLMLSVPYGTKPRVTAEDLRAMEVELLNALDHRLSTPTPFDFMEAVCFEEYGGNVPSLVMPVQMIIRHMTTYPSAYPPSELAWAALRAAGIKVSVSAAPGLVKEMKKHA